MKKVEKQQYDAPWTQILTVANEGVICTSGETEDFGEGSSYGEGDFS
ncbi:MAG: hypothetical protein IJK74_07510 [Bacteroidales bacterium]|nr:hypothetical protein [Bacteroidales bacterium]